jgi:hypothetical protein
MGALSENRHKVRVFPCLCDDFALFVAVGQSGSATLFSMTVTTKNGS